MPAPTNPGKPGKKDGDWAKRSKTISFWLLVILVPVAFIQLAGSRSDQPAKITYSFYTSQLEENNIESIKIEDGTIANGVFRQPVPVPGEGHDAKKFTFRFPAKNSEGEIKALTAKHVTIEGEDAKPSILSMVVAFLPWILILGVYIFMIRQMQAGGQKAFSFGKSKAKLLSGDTPKITFADVAGADEAKEELEEIIEFLRDPQ